MFYPFVFSNVMMTNNPHISRSIFYSDNKNVNIYIQIWAPVKYIYISFRYRIRLQVIESYFCSSFPHCRWEETYLSKPFTETILKPISLTHVPHISWQGKYSRFCFLSSFDQQNIIPPSQMCHHAGLLSKHFKQEMLDWQLNSITLFN